MKNQDPIGHYLRRSEEAAELRRREPDLCAQLDSMDEDEYYSFLMMCAFAMEARGKSAALPLLMHMEREGFEAMALARDFFQAGAEEQSPLERLDHEKEAAFVRHVEAETAKLSAEAKDRGTLKLLETMGLGTRRRLTVQAVDDISRDDDVISSASTNRLHRPRPSMHRFSRAPTEPGGGADGNLPTDFDEDERVHIGPPPVHPLEAMLDIPDVALDETVDEDISEGIPPRSVH